MSKQVLIFGAGKIGRGFLGQLFSRSGYQLWFVDAFPELVMRLNAEKKYRVDLAGRDKDLTEYIRIEGAFTIDDANGLAELFDKADIIVSSVGAANIENTARLVKKLLANTSRNRPLNWLICENASHPAASIRSVLLEDADEHFAKFVREQVGLIETQILRTGMDAGPAIIGQEPLALRMQDWWTLPCDKDAFVGPIPDVKGLVPKSNFSNELTRKLYTFNGTNGPISYIGWANGFKILHQAAMAFQDFFSEIQEESAHGLIHEFGLDHNEQKAFMELAMKKYTDPALVDQTERNARDPKRKLAKDERLIGPALLCLKHGKRPEAYAKAIAAAYAYEGANDKEAQEIQTFIDLHGIGEAIKKYSSIDETSQLFSMITDAYNGKRFIFSGNRGRLAVPGPQPPS